MSDIDTVIAKVVEDIWGTYDKDNSGALDKDETKQFVKDTLKEMADGDDNDEFNEEVLFRVDVVAHAFCHGVVLSLKGVGGMDTAGDGSVLSELSLHLILTADAVVLGDVVLLVVDSPAVIDALVANNI